VDRWQIREYHPYCGHGLYVAYCLALASFGSSISPGVNRAQGTASRRPRTNNARGASWQQRSVLQFLIVNHDDRAWLTFLCRLPTIFEGVFLCILCVAPADGGRESPFLGSRKRLFYRALTIGTQSAAIWLTSFGGLMKGCLFIAGRRQGLHGHRYIHPRGRYLCDREVLTRVVWYAQQRNRTYALLPRNSSRQRVWHWRNDGVRRLDRRYA
jgi:hypothetical protein